MKPDSSTTPRHATEEVSIQEIKKTVWFIFDSKHFHANSNFQVCSNTEWDRLKHGGPTDFDEMWIDWDREERRECLFHAYNRDLCKLLTLTYDLVKILDKAFAAYTFNKILVGFLFIK